MLSAAHTPAELITTIHTARDALSTVLDGLSLRIRLPSPSQAGFVRGRGEGSVSPQTTQEIRDALPALRREAMLLQNTVQQLEAMVGGGEGPTTPPTPQADQHTPELVTRGELSSMLATFGDSLLRRMAEMLETKR